MSQLKKLRIQGFRSFGPDDADGQVMDFESKEAGAGGQEQVWPLTLILVKDRQYNLTSVIQ